MTARMTAAGRLVYEPGAGRLERPAHSPDWRAIADAAETLGERLTRVRRSDFDATRTSDSSDLDAWAAVVTQGDTAAFARRLEWDELSASRAAALVAHPSGTPAAWMPTLVDAWDRARDTASQPDTADERLSTPLLQPFMSVARERLRRVAGGWIGRLSPHARDVLEHSLIKRLDAVGSRAASTLPHQPHDQHDQHDQHEPMHDDGAARFARFITAYPMAARLCATVVDLWVAATTEFLQRLDADWSQIAATFGDGTPLEPVSHLIGDCSDPHGGGRTVLIAEWESGLSVVYKPRTVGVDAAFSRLIDRLNPHLGEFALHSLRVLPRDDFGWIQRAELDVCSSGADVERYYARCGALLCLVYALNGTDFHHENLLACGEHPVLLDLEMLLGPRFTLVEELPAAGLASIASGRDVLESVLNLRMLPVAKEAGFGAAVDVGALSDTAGGHHRAAHDGRAVPASAYVDAIVRGFTLMHEVLRRESASLIASGGVLDALRDETVRIVLRNTSLYQALIQRTLRPEYLRSGLAFGVQLDVLAKTFLSMEDRPTVWPAVNAERRELEQMDVPIFSVGVDSRDLRCERGVVARDAFVESPYEMMLRRLHGLDDADLARQVDFIRGAFAATARRGLHSRRLVAAVSGHDPREQRPIARDESIAAARAIANEVLGRAATRTATETSWIGAAYAPSSRRYTLQPMRYDLFDGYGGLSLFFAALARVSGDDSARATALSALAPLRTRFRVLERLMRIRRASDVGLGFGPASVALALARIGRLLDEPDLLGESRGVIDLVTPRLVETQDAHDVIAGSAGAILILIALHAQFGDAELLKRAALFGAHLVERRIRIGDSLVWRAPTRIVDSGFAHGQAGIAYALQRLGAVMGERAFSDAADQAIAFERARMASSSADVGRDDLTAAWSHGRTGIALARLGGGAADDAALRDIDDGLALARRNFGCGVHSLCCGDAGRIDLFVESASRLRRRALFDEAQRMAGSLVSHGRYDTGWGDQQTWELGLFHGTAGIGYTLLRVAEPALIPSVLLIA